MSSETPTPVILCGKTEVIGRSVIEGLKPEYEVVQFITGPEAAITEIALILNGQSPPFPISTIGTSNLSVRPKAIVLGGGFIQTFEHVRDEVEKEFADKGGSGVVWCMHDASKPHPPLGPEYAKAVLDRCRELLGRLGEEGKLDAGKTETYYY